ncbi:hypothetical protein, partial [Klebsiella pneumoniae]|uniref:hypothetical protein n=1 Tax=Klebsiella pneumoniae TaxID=573 RepID=UPI001C400561
MHSGLCGREALAKPPGAAASGGYKRQHFANPALDLNSREISYARNSAYRAAPDETFWSVGGTPKTHLVPLILSLAQSGGNDKTFPVRINTCR